MFCKITYAEMCLLSILPIRHTHTHTNTTNPVPRGSRATGPVCSPPPPRSGDNRNTSCRHRTPPAQTSPHTPTGNYSPPYTPATSYTDSRGYPGVKTPGQGAPPSAPEGTRLPRTRNSLGPRSRRGRGTLPGRQSLISTQRLPPLPPWTREDQGEAVGGS